MGAMDFQNKVKAPNAQAGFDSLVDKYSQYGSEDECGYTGTIAEKNGFRMIPRDTKVTIQEQIDGYAHDLVPGWNPYDDKWGPAGCIAHEDGEHYTFFGIASS